MTKVLVAEDSTTVRELLVAILKTDPDIAVVGEAKSGAEAIEMTKRLKPEVVTMDIQMPGVDGFAATKEIMIERPTPIVIVSGLVDVHETTVVMQALNAGALAVLPKPSSPQDPGFGEQSYDLLQTVKSMAQVKVVRHWRGRPPPAPVLEIPLPRAGVRCAVVAIAVSTGGPQTLHRLLSAMPGDFRAPILIVQHMATGFIQGLAGWLNTVVSLRVKVAEEDEPLNSATVYLAPDDRHLGVANGGRIALSDASPIAGFRPSGTFLFDSVAKGFGARTVAVIMTGMGADGVEGLKTVRRLGGWIVVQDKATSVVYGMPAAAVGAGLVDVELPLAAISNQLWNRVHYEGKGNKGNADSGR